MLTSLAGSFSQLQLVGLEQALLNITGNAALTSLAGLEVGALSYCPQPAAAGVGKACYRVPQGTTQAGWGLQLCLCMRVLLGMFCLLLHAPRRCFQV